MQAGIGCLDMAVGAAACVCQQSRRQSTRELTLPETDMSPHGPQ